MASGRQTRRWQAHACLTVPDGTTGADLEPEPVADVATRGFAQLSFGHLTCPRPIHVNIDCRAHAQIPSKERGGTLDDPPIIDHVETFKQAVVGELPLELRQRPPAPVCDGAQPVRECAAERTGAAVSSRARH